MPLATPDPRFPGAHLAPVEWGTIVSLDDAVALLSTYGDNARAWVEARTTGQLCAHRAGAWDCNERSSFVAYNSLVVARGGRAWGAA